MSFSLPFMKKNEAYQNLNVSEVYQQIQSKTDPSVLIDVRQPSEWLEGTIADAMRIPLGELPSQLDKLDKNRKYILICRSGNRSKSAAEIMAQAGFKNLVNFQGGMMAWYQQGYPVVK